MAANKGKTDLVESVANKSGLSKADAGKAVDAVLGSVTEILGAGDALTVPGFGKFEVTHKAARKGRNVATGAEIDIPARNAPKFTPGKQLKDAVNA
jgi:DNA-binding protein HU-beta